MHKKYNILHFQKINSTNAYAMENLEILTDRQIIISDIQTEGRGQFERKWLSDKSGNVYLTIVLKKTKLANYTPHMAQAVCNVLKTYGIEPTIKEPNDVMVNGKKIAGILSQSSTRGNKLNGIVLGVGVNLNLTQQDIASIDQLATSLNLLLNMAINRDIFINQLLEEFFKLYPPPKKPTISSESPSFSTSDS